VVQPYFRGSSGRGRAFAAAGYGEWGGLMQDDVTDAVLHFQAAGLASPEDTCIVGGSYGGYAALWGGAATPELYACVASLNGVTDLVALIKYEARANGRDSLAYAHAIETIGDPRKDREKLERTSPLTYAANYRLPVHLAHGEADKIVPVEQSRRMAKALDAAGVPVEYHEYENERHNFRSRDTDIAYWKSLAAFLAAHIGGGG
jgi:dipeptidyl aminopeptidase/acylaminoacyl peptidase